MIEADVDIPKGQARLRPASHLLLLLHLWLPQWSFCYINRGHFPLIELPPPDSRTDVDLGIVFFVGLQSTLLEAHTKSLNNGQCVLGWWKDVVVVWQMRDPDIVMTWELWRECWYQWWLDIRIEFVGHVLGSYEQIMWVVICRDHVIGRSCDHDITINNIDCIIKFDFIIVMFKIYGITFLFFYLKLILQYKISNIC